MPVLNIKSPNPSGILHHAIDAGFFCLGPNLARTRKVTGFAASINVPAVRCYTLPLAESHVNAASFRVNDVCPLTFCALDQNAVTPQPCFAACFFKTTILYLLAFTPCHRRSAPRLQFPRLCATSLDGRCWHKHMLPRNTICGCRTSPEDPK